MDELYQDSKLVEIYDAINSSREDFDFYVAELPGAPAALLDIGCGTGTFALDLADRGYSVTAVDPASKMIAMALQKDTGRSVNWVAGFVDDLASHLRFDAAIMTGHAFQCLLEDSEISGLFDAVKQRLHPDGSFWFETRNPDARPWLRWTPAHVAPPFDLGDGRKVEVVQQVLHVDDDLVTFEERYNFSGSTEALTSQSTLRFLELDKIEALAASSGLRVSETFGNWKREPFTAGKPEIIIRLTTTA